MSNDRESTDSDTAGLSRRKFLMGTGVAAIAVVAAACSSDTKSSSNVSTSTTAASSSMAASDAKTAATAAGLEVLAVNTYKATLDAASAGKLGTVPPAVATFVQTAMAQHQAAADKWNSVVTSGGGATVTQPPADIKATVDQQFAQVKDVTGAARLALLLEQTAADTYLSALPVLGDKGAITLAGSLQIAAQEHAAILHYVLGEYPVPDVFQKTDLTYKG